MTMIDILEAIREPYIRTLAEAVRVQPAHVEPTFRRADGALATEGVLNLPCRTDFIPKSGADAGRSVMVDSKSELQFDPVFLDIGGTAVAISPFSWDWAQIEVIGLTDEVHAALVSSWFLRWFDEEDRNPLTAEGLYGVLHFMSDPVPTESGCRVTVDLGSCGARAVADFIAMVHEAGGKRIVLSRAP